MDFQSLTVTELKQGYQYRSQEAVYVCNYCQQTFETGRVYQFAEEMFLGKQAVEWHISEEHGGNFLQLLSNESKYNTLTDKQKQLLSAFQSGKKDAQIAEEMNVSHSTIRHQKFSFREKAKQAKLYLAIYENAFLGHLQEEIIPIHNGATMVDERYFMTIEEREQIINENFESLHPLKLKRLPKKEKKKIAILSRIIKEFVTGRTYGEDEMKEILVGIYDDYVTIRRYLIDYGYMNRTPDGKAYWVND